MEVKKKKTCKMQCKYLCQSLDKGSDTLHSLLIFSSSFLLLLAQ